MKLFNAYVIASLTFICTMLILVFLPQKLDLCGNTNQICIQTFTDWLAACGVAGTVASFVLSILKDSRTKKEILINSFDNKITIIIEKIQQFKDLGYQYWCSAGMKPADRDLLTKRIAGLEKDISRALTRLHNCFDILKNETHETVMLFVKLKNVATGGNFGSKMFIPTPDTCDDITENADMVISALHSLSDKAHKL